jgi:hypothetical protein
VAVSALAADKPATLYAGQQVGAIKALSKEGIAVKRGYRCVA